MRMKVVPPNYANQVPYINRIETFHDPYRRDQFYHEHDDYDYLDNDQYYDQPLQAWNSYDYGNLPYYKPYTNGYQSPAQGGNDLTNAGRESLSDVTPLELLGLALLQVN